MFRQDLYYRLNVGEIRLPPLRERKSDIPKIALYVLEHIIDSLKNQKRLTTEALQQLQNYPWYGNARDLENAIERSVRLSKMNVLDAGDILINHAMIPDSSDYSILPDTQPGFSLKQYLANSRKELIKKALETAGGNQSKAACLLGVSPQAVHKYMKKPSQ